MRSGLKKRFRREVRKVASMCLIRDPEIARAVNSYSLNMGLDDLASQDDEIRALTGIKEPIPLSTMEWCAQPSEGSPIVTALVSRSYLT
jgi:hypothetical protein